jgi:preprotein translocase subunit SecD
LGNTYTVAALEARKRLSRDPVELAVLRDVIPIRVKADRGSRVTLRATEGGGRATRATTAKAASTDCSDDPPVRDSNVDPPVRESNVGRGKRKKSPTVAKETDEPSSTSGGEAVVLPAVKKSAQDLRKTVNATEVQQVARTSPEDLRRKINAKLTQEEQEAHKWAADTADWELHEIEAALLELNPEHDVAAVSGYC